MWGDARPLLTIRCWLFFQVINGVNQKMKQAAADAVPPASNDALKGLKMK